MIGKPFAQFINATYPKGSIMQYYGENPALYAQFKLAGHNGIDLVAPWGTPLFAVADGKVCEASYNSGYGNVVRTINEEDEWTYGHLATIAVTAGQMVKTGDCVGMLGNTGFVISGPTPYWKANPFAGSHEHLGLRKYKPYAQGDTSWNISYTTGDKGTILNYDNGFLGAVNFAHLLPGAPTVPQPDITALQLTVISLANQVISLLKQLLAKKG